MMAQVYMLCEGLPKGLWGAGQGGEGARRDFGGRDLGLTSQRDTDVSASIVL